MEQLVVSLETAKKLKQAGFMAWSSTQLVWVWTPWRKTPSGEHDWTWQVHPATTRRRVSEAYAAPTAQEIADQLPTGFRTGRVAPDDTLYYAVRGDYGYYDAPTVAEALAQLWLVLPRSES